MGIGYPRSGNTFLVGWLTFISRGRIQVLDGRLSHSAIDLHRFARTGRPVLVPVRDPEDTIASFMVRANRTEDRDFAQRALLAYDGWYRSIRRSLKLPTVFLIPFEAIKTDLRAVANLFDPSLVNTHRLKAGHEVVVDWLRGELSEIEGQGRPQRGVPAIQMISLPTADRSQLLERAHDVLESKALIRHRARALRAHRDLLDISHDLGRLLSEFTTVEGR